MIRRNFHLTEDQNEFLESLDELPVSEHLRRAVDDYIIKKKKQKVKRVSSSPVKKNG